MSKIRYLRILFDQPMQSYEIPKLRAAIIEKTKRESSLFHNHLNDEQYIYRYPLIQYKIKDKKPCIICLGDATEDIHYLLKQKDFKFNLGGKKYDFEIEDVWLKFHQLQTWQTTFKYSVLHYIALNQDNYKEYKELIGIVEKVTYLEGMLHKHISLLMKELNAHEAVPLAVKLLNIKGEKFIEYKDVFHLTFNIEIQTNLDIPEFAGIGKGVSVGFGIIKKINHQENGNNEK
jgi:hypothetical protein